MQNTAHIAPDASMSSPSGRWFYSPGFDLAFFHIPIWLGWCIVLWLAPQELLNAKVPIWAWVGIVLLIDVAHVWATMFRTYFDREAFARNRDLLVGLPLACFVGAFVVASINTDLFWTVLAYIAVFHFVKQQYGITALYHGRLFGQLKHLPEADREACQALLVRLPRIDKIAIYIATLFPVLYWHIHLPKKIWWFSKWDFLPFLMWIYDLKDTATGALLYDIGAVVGVVIWIGSIAVWLGYHIHLRRRFGMVFPLGKMMWVLGTYANWFIGIVLFNSPFAFTLTNVIAHGIPYFGLVYIYSENAWREKRSTWHEVLSRRSVAILVFVLPLLFFAFWEEYLWDLLVRGGEYKSFFTMFLSYPRPKVADQLWFAFWIALLSVPQTTHYLLDRYLWRPGKRNPHLKARLRM